MSEPQTHKIHHRSRFFWLFTQRRTHNPPEIPQHRSRRHKCRPLLHHRRTNRSTCRRPSSSSNSTIYGLVACHTGVGVQVFANKIPGVYAATCLSVDEAKNTRSINNANVLAVSGMSTSPDTAMQILDTFINTPFKSPCPASGDKEWDPELSKFLDDSVPKMAKIGKGTDQETITDCAICCLAKTRELVPVEIMPGGMMKIVRESPTSAIVCFKAGSVEPAHHHTFGHDLVVMKGSKRVEFE